MFFYDPDGQLIGEYWDNASTATPTDDWLVRQETIWLEDIPVAVIRKPTATSPIQIYYIHADHLNTPRVIVNTANTIFWRWENTHAFGTNLLMKTRTAMRSCLNIITDSPGSISTARRICITTTSDTMSLRLGGMYRLIQSGSLEESIFMGYVEQNPLSLVDPFPQGVVDAVAGFGDSLTVGITYRIRELMNINNVDICSNSYIGGVSAGALVHVIGFRTGGELSIGRNIRVAPWGNRTGHPSGELPHYHRRGKIGIDGRPLPGQGKNRHRPWEGF